MPLQRQHFLLSYLKTLSVGLAGVWTRGLPLSRPALSQLSRIVCLVEMKSDLVSICSRNKQLLTHLGANCVVSGAFHSAILTEENRIASKILFYQLSRQRQLNPIFCTQIPLELARKPYRIGVLFKGDNVRSCAAPILKVYRHRYIGGVSVPLFRRYVRAWFSFIFLFLLKTEKIHSSRKREEGPQAFTCTSDSTSNIKRNICAVCCFYKVVGNASVDELSTTW